MVALSGFLGARVPALLARTAGAMWLSLFESQTFYLCQITCPAEEPLTSLNAGI